MGLSIPPAACDSKTEGSYSVPDYYGLLWEFFCGWPSSKSCEGFACCSFCNVSWLLANVMTKSSCCFWKCNRNSGHRIFVSWFAQYFGQVIINISTPTVRSWWSQWGVMAAHHCYSWGRWWSDTLWATFRRLWLHSLFCYLQLLWSFFITHTYLLLHLSGLNCDFGSMKLGIQHFLWEQMMKVWTALCLWIVCPFVYGLGEVNCIVK